MNLVRVKAVVHNIVDKSDGSAMPFIGLEDIESGTGRLICNDVPLKTADSGICHRDGDVLFGKLRPYLAKSVLPETEGTGTGELLVLRPERDVDPRFLWYTTLSAPWLEWANTTSYGSKMPRTSWEDMSNFRMWKPALGEQRRIADFLDAETSRIDRLRALQNNVAKKALERFVALVDSALDGIVTRYGLLSFRRVVSRISQGSSPECHAVPAEVGDWGVLKLSSIKKGKFDGGENKLLPDGTSPVLSNQVRRGDLLVTRANTPELVGDSAVIDEPCARRLLPDLIYRVTLTDAMDPHFASLVVNGSRVRGLIQAVARGSSQSMVKLRGEDIKEWPVPCPPLREQRRFVEDVHRQRAAVHTLRGTIDRQLDLLAERRQALITAAVTGQLDVTTARSGVRV